MVKMNLVQHLDILINFFKTNMTKILRKIGFVLLTVFSIFIAIVIYVYMSVSVQREYVTSHVDIGTNYKSIFIDKNSVQLPSANRMGITPQDDESNIAQLVSDSKLVRLYPCQYYITVASLPYLTPEAADLLAEIGRRYKEKLGYRFLGPIVTSMFRTNESVKKLQMHNGNAVTNSCHLRGTTFDITYSRMNINERRAMAQVLADLRNAGYCHVLYEVNQPCFHITVRK